MEHGRLEVKRYASRGTDPQRPDSRGEAYVVVRGSGESEHGSRRDRFGPRLPFRSPAYRTFEGFMDDLLLRVIFYGSEGGEKPSSRRPEAARDPGEGRA